MLAAIPSGVRPAGPAWVPIAVLALPYLAGLFAGIVTVRIAPTPVIEAAPLWGFAAGMATGLLAGLAAAFAGGPLGDGRLSAVGPSGFQVGLVAILEIGVTAALAAAAANWLILRRATRRRTAPPTPEEAVTAVGAFTPMGVVDETDNADGHRIYLNPWAAGDEGDLEDQDDEIPIGVIEEYRDEP
jgi:hypothetical protein